MYCSMAYRFLRLAGCMFRDLIECAIPGTRFLIGAENVGSRIDEACAASAPHAKYLHFQNGQKRMLSGYCPVAQPAGKNARNWWTATCIPCVPVRCQNDKHKLAGQGENVVIKQKERKKFGRVVMGLNEVKFSSTSCEQK
jgi:hypothetical protein